MFCQLPFIICACIIRYFVYQSREFSCISVFTIVHYSVSYCIVELLFVVQLSVITVMYHLVYQLSLVSVFFSVFFLVHCFHLMCHFCWLSFCINGQSVSFHFSVSFNVRFIFFSLVSSFSVMRLCSSVLSVVSVIECPFSFLSLQHIRFSVFLWLVIVLFQMLKHLLFYRHSLVHSLVLKLFSFSFSLSDLCFHFLSCCSFSFPLSILYFTLFSYVFSSCSISPQSLLTLVIGLVIFSSQFVFERCAFLKSWVSHSFSLSDFLFFNLLVIFLILIHSFYNRDSSLVFFISFPVSFIVQS